MNADDIATLRSRGARLGDSNAHQWRELVTAYSLERVRYAVVNCKIGSDGNQVTVEEAAKKLGHKLRSVAEAIKPRASAPDAPAAPVRGRADAPAAVVTVAARAPEPTPVLRAKDELARLKEAEAPTNRPKQIDYLSILREHPGSTIQQIATFARVRDESARTWLTNHHTEVRGEGAWRKQYWLKDDHRPPLPQPAPAPKAYQNTNPGGKGIDYLAIIERLGSPYAKDICAAAGVSASTVSVWLKKHQDLVIAIPAGQNPRWKVRRVPMPTTTAGIIPRNNSTPIIPSEAVAAAPAAEDDYEETMAALRPVPDATAPVQITATAPLSEANRAALKAGIEDSKAGRIGPPLDFTKPEFQDDKSDAAAPLMTGLNDGPPESILEPSLPRREREGSSGERSGPISEQEAPPAPPSSPVGEPTCVLSDTAPMTRSTLNGLGHPTPAELAQAARTTLAFTVTFEEMGGDLREIINRLLDCYSDRHGFAHSYRQVALALAGLSPSGFP